MIREDRELLVELKEASTHITDFVLGVLGANPVDPHAQRELADHLLTVGQSLRDGQPINGYVNGVLTIPLGSHPAVDLDGVACGIPEWGTSDRASGDEHGEDVDSAGSRAASEGHPVWAEPHR